MRELGNGLFALMKSQRSKRQLSKSFAVVIRPLSTHLIKPDFEVKVRQSLVENNFSCWFINTKNTLIASKDFFNLPNQNYGST